MTTADGGEENLPPDTEKPAGAAEDVEEKEEEKEKGPAPEERVAMAESAKEAGNALLKAGDAAGATAKYSEGVEIAEPLLEQKPEDIGEELQQRGTAVYLALRLNSAQACIKQNNWVDAIEHANKVLLLEKDNTKALYRRGLAAVQLDTEGRLEEARSDFARMVQLEPTNREAREQHQKAKERLKDLKQQEKERLSAAMKGGLYQEQHKKLGRLQASYDEEVKRRKEAGEDEISFEDWAKKEKEKQDELEKKQKEATEKKRKEEAAEEENRQWQADNASRVAEGQEELSLEDWRSDKAKKAAESRKAEQVVKMNEDELDEEDKKLLQETKSKGYYHGRLGTVLSNDAPKPQLVSENSDSQSAPSAGKGSQWNQGGTWEEKDVSSWAKDRIRAWLLDASVSSSDVELPSGSSGEVTAKVSKVKSLSGEAHIVYVRNQAKHGFNFEAELGFSISLGEDKHSGTLSLPELLDSMPPAELRVDARWKGSGPSGEVLSLATEWLNKLREKVRSQVAAFKEEYQAKS
eukprot:TRINITY_DN13245_c0_g1_i4.p1 TRINITY_DN13245_c0_g1~~TRINITY_DN13245_c0_g1_i4.p1  ORF type:complete len:556 (-),score=182.69 TRINITY_DN13245_c0_g1_i4:130-1692(-)